MVERVKYICLRCGNVYESRAKTPQCPVCRSKRKMKLEEFLKLPKESQEKVLGKVRGGNKSEKSVKNGEITGGDGESVVKEGEDKVKKGEIPAVKGEDGVKYGESPKITKGEMVKKGESPGLKVVHRGDDGEITRVKREEKVKGERVKRLSIPKPRLSFKAYAILGGLAFAYVMYHFGWFDEVWKSLKRLAAFAKSKPKEEAESNPLLERVNKNLSG